MLICPFSPLLLSLPKIEGQTNLFLRESFPFLFTDCLTYHLVSLFPLLWIYFFVSDGMQSEREN
jgi:hypothetical protein